VRQRLRGADRSNEETSSAASEYPLLAGTFIQLDVKVLDAVGTVITDAPVTYEASAGAPFSISTDGQVSAGLTPGTGVVVVQSGELRQDVPVEVFPPTHPQGTVAATTQTGGSPWQAAISLTGLVLVRGGPNGILRGMLPSYDLTSADPAIDANIAVAISPAGSRVFTAAASVDVKMRDPSTLSVINVLGYQPGFVEDMIAGEKENVAYIATDNGDVAKLDFESLSATNVGYFPRSSPGPMARRSGSEFFYVVGYSSGVQSVFEFDPAQRDGRFVSLGGRIGQLAPTRQGDVVYATDGSDFIQVLNFASGAGQTFQLGCGGFGLALTPDESQLYATCPATGQVKIVDVSSRTVVGTLQVGGAPRLVTVSPDGATVVVPNSVGWVDFIQ
jgi:DNA-binding beta-propeller fold protein YncE